MGPVGRLRRDVVGLVAHVSGCGLCPVHRGPPMLRTAHQRLAGSKEVPEQLGALAAYGLSP